MIDEQRVDVSPEAAPPAHDALLEELEFESYAEAIKHWQSLDAERYPDVPRAERIEAVLEGLNQRGIRAYQRLLIWYRRLVTFVRHVVYNLRGGFLVRPILIAVELGVIGAMLSLTEENSPYFNNLAPKAFFPPVGDPAVAQAILGNIASSMMTVVSIVFAVLLMTLALASQQFSPRIIVNFVRDRISQQTLGLYLGTFLYCLAALPATRTTGTAFSPVWTVMGAMVLAVCCVAWLLFFINHVSELISVSYIVNNIARETEAMIREMLPQPRPFTAREEGVYAEARFAELPVPGVVSGYVRSIDVPRLVDSAKANHVSVRVLRRVGHFIPTGSPLMMVRAEALSQGLMDELRASFDFGPTRTLQQDVEFGVLQIVDIALKAVSPAVNDPTTCITSIDQLCSILMCLAGRDDPVVRYFDPPGKLRLSLPGHDFASMIEVAFEQIRLYTQEDYAVTLRLLRALGDIAAAIPDPATRKLLVDFGQRIMDGRERHMDPDVYAALQPRWQALQQLAAST